MQAESLRLPPELVGEVLDHLHADRDALAACALVCREWLAFSRPSLFYRLTKKPMGNPISFSYLPTQLSQFTQISGYIRDLHLKAESASGVILDQHHIVSILNLTPSLRRLHLEGMHLSPQSKVVFEGGPAFSLEQLSLSTVHMNDGDALLSFLSNFTFIEEFRMEKSFVYGSSVPHPLSSIPDRPRIASLVVDNATNYTTMFPILHLPSLEIHLISLTITIRSAGFNSVAATFGALGSFLTAAGSNIEHLAITIPQEKADVYVDDSSLDAVCQCMSLNRCVNLQSFSLRISLRRFLRTRQSRVNLWPFASAALRSIPPTTNRIRLILSNEDLHESFEVGWHEITRILRRFKNPQAFRIQTETKHDGTHLLGRGIVPLLESWEELAQNFAADTSY